MIEYKLLQDPAYIGSVCQCLDQYSNWSTLGTFFGSCDNIANDLACTISLNNSQTSYYYYDEYQESYYLNTYIYANNQDPKQDYLEIWETPSGIGSDRIISSIVPKHWDPYGNWPNGGAYITISLGSNLTFKNARE